MDIAYKWCLDFSRYKQEAGMPPRHFKDGKEIQKIQDEGFALTQSMMKTHYYGGYSAMLKYIKTGKEFEACFEDGKLDLAKSKYMLSEHTEMSSKAADVLLSEYDIDSLEDLHDMFFRCVTPQIEVHEVKETKARESRQTADSYENYGTYLCLFTLGVSFFYFNIKAKEMREEGGKVSWADRDVYDKVFVDHFLSTAEQTSDENPINRA